MDSEEKVYNVTRVELEELGYKYREKQNVTTWCGRDRHDDQANFIVYVKFRGGDEPFCVIEAKPSDEDINRVEWVNQARSYAFWIRGNVIPLTPFFIVYNGRVAAIHETITGNRKKSGRSLKDVMPPPAEAEKILERFLETLIKAYERG